MGALDQPAFDALVSAGGPAYDAALLAIRTRNNPGDSSDAFWMRPVFAAFVIILAVIIATARGAIAGACGGYLEVGAVASPMPRDGVVMIEMLGERDTIEPALQNTRFVTAAGDIPARVVDMLEGGHLQILLVPTKPLPANETVHLAIGIAEIDKELMSFPLAVGPDATSKSPRWRAPPRSGRWIDVRSNKGDGVHAKAVNADLVEAAWVLATITTNDRVARAVYRIGTHEIAIGTVGCYSMYAIRNSEPARIELTAIGASGQQVAAPGAPLKVRF